MDERATAITQACEEAAERLRRRMPDAEVTVVLRDGNVLRQVAHRGTLRVIYEFPRQLGGVVWRAADEAVPQVVPDVKIDPDYIAVDGSVRSEIAVPVRVGDGVVGVLNAESAERQLGDGDLATVEAEAVRLGAALGPLYTS